MKYISSFIYTFIIATVTICAFAASPGPSGAVDWIRGSVTGYSSSGVEMNAAGRPVNRDNGQEISLNRGRMDASDRARERALERLVRHITGIRVDSNHTLSDLLESDEETGSRFMGLITESVLFREYPLSFTDTGCRTELKIRDIIPVLPFTYPAHEFPLRTDNPIKTSYTGLIIDTRGQSIEPMIFPSIFNEKGLEIFSRRLIDIASATKHGTVSYAFTEDQALKNGRAGDRPYFTVSLRGIKGCPVLSDRDTRKILSSKKTREALKQCRVIFIIDKNKRTQ